MNDEKLRAIAPMINFLQCFTNAEVGDIIRVEIYEDDDKLDRTFVRKDMIKKVSDELYAHVYKGETLDRRPLILTIQSLIIDANVKYRRTDVFVHEGKHCELQYTATYKWYIFAAILHIITCEGLESMVKELEKLA